MHIVLLEPEIPQNAGNIARTCAVTNSVLHLIKPLGFSVEDKYLKRAGLDYWKLLDIRYYENFEDFCEKNPNAKIWMASTKARHIYTDVTYGENDYIMFGKESAGIPEEILMAHEANTIRIPMLEAARSLNLSNSVALIIYEAMRQQGFPGMLMVLSGMSTPEQVQDNISFMKDFNRWTKRSLLPSRRCRKSSAARTSSRAPAAATARTAARSRSPSRNCSPR